MWDEPFLREQFQALKREDALRAPEFERLLAAPARPSRRVLLWAAAFGALVLLWTLPGRRSGTAGPPGPELSQWRSPTDFLLDTPGQELLTSIPNLGTGALPARVPASKEKPS